MRAPIGEIVLSTDHDPERATRELRAAFELLVRTEGAASDPDRTFHQIANRLTAALLHLGVIESVAEDGYPVSPDQLRELVDPVRQDIRLIRDLVEKGRERLPLRQSPGSCELGEVLQPLVTGLRRDHPHVTCTYDGPGLLEVRGEAAHIEGAVRHLLLNAVEGDGQRGATRISITVRDEGIRARLLVVDDGPGLPPMLGGVGRPFFTTKPGRTGLGLFTCARLATLVGGSFEALSLPGGGVRAQLVLKCQVPD